MNTAVAKAPTHLWIVGILSLLWNAYGGYDYLMSVTRNEAYLAAFPPEMVTYMETAPVWATAGWAIGVWASLLGSVLLLLRSRYAAHAFLASLLGALASFGYQFTADVPEALTEGFMAIMPFAILTLILGQWYYAHRMGAAGVLR